MNENAASWFMVGVLIASCSIGVITSSPWGFFSFGVGFIFIGILEYLS